MSTPTEQTHTDFVEVELSTPSGEKGRDRLPLEILSDGVRTRRALKSAGTAFAVGAVLIFLPLMHLVGPLVSWSIAVTLLVRRLGERERLLDATVCCPKCGASAPVAAQRLQWPLITVCRGCRWQITVQPAPKSAAGEHETGARAPRV